VSEAEVLTSKHEGNESILESERVKEEKIEQGPVELFTNDGYKDNLHFKDIEEMDLDSKAYEYQRKVTNIYCKSDSGFEI